MTAWFNLNKTTFYSVLLVFLLSSCGGGATQEPVASQNPSVSLLANQCASPRTGLDPQTGNAYLDQSGSINSEKKWVYAFLDETYLWYRELPSLDAAAYFTPINYFNALKTPVITASGKLKDEFHFTVPTADWVAETQSGESVDYGIDWVFLSATAPRSIVVKMVEPNSPAASAQVFRGIKLLKIDNIDVINTQSQQDINALNAAIFPASSGQSHLFEFETLSGARFTKTLTSATITKQPVNNVKTFTIGASKVGYVQFNEHITTAQPQLLNAFNLLKSQNVDDLVLDLRYNGGGYLTMASQVAYMVAPVTATQGKTFERLIFNDKNPFNISQIDSQVGFVNTTVNFGLNGGASGLALPNLGLNRVYVLTTKSTASASEAIINGLRGVGVTVNIIGDSTRGKPYGFYPEDNCGTTYFAVQFQGVNQLGFGDYADGFTPTCAATDDYTQAIGSANEKMLAQALYHQSTGFCSNAFLSAPAKNGKNLSKTGLSLKQDTRIQSLFKMRRDISK